MPNTDNKFLNMTPFHAGEKAIQASVGVRERIEHFGRRAMRSFMPDQHRDFYNQLPFMVVGSVDADGWPWASILSGRPGFMTTPDATTLSFDAVAEPGDPLGKAIKPGSPLGFLGIELGTRRRNRVNGRVINAGAEGFAVAVDMAFGNCPQYIQTRTVDFLRDPKQQTGDSQIEEFVTLSEEIRRKIRRADTFFVSSYVRAGDRPEVEGVDVSHRGGRPGFVKVVDNTLTIPDYSGNFHFNTLGNFLTNPKAGLIFVDFDTGDLIMLTGTVELYLEKSPEIEAFEGAERAWSFTLDHGVTLKNALPFHSKLEEYSRNTLITGDWGVAAATLAAAAKSNAWRPFRVVRIEDESSTIRSFYLEPDDAGGLAPFEAGQFLPVRLTPPDAMAPIVRTYTVSSAPGASYYRISVKREMEGQVSSFLHAALKVDDLIEAKAPRGGFIIDPTQTRPAVLIAGGVGVTPMIAMAQHIVNEGFRLRNTRPVTIFHASQTTEQRAFAESFQALQAQSDGRIAYYSVISKPAANEKPGVDFNATGYINADILRQTLALDDYDFYLCGPPAFMQALYNTLRDLGVRDVRVFAEAFGPAALTRRPDVGAAPFAPEAEADNAIVKFGKSGFEQQWSAGDDTLLETAEAHGLNPEFGCRNGVCGSCAVKLKAGSVAYRTEPTAKIENDDVLVCCAVPAKGSQTVEIDL